MKTVQNFGILFTCLLVAQMVISNYFNFGPYVLLSVLPAMIICLPVSIDTIWTMIIAFASGLLIDCTSDGLPGLNAMALVPVALSHKTIIRFFLGEDLLNRGEDFSFKKNGAAKISWAIIAAQTMFFIIYILGDGAGVRPLWFNLARFAGGMLCSLPMSLITANILTSGNN